MMKHRIVKEIGVSAEKLFEHYQIEKHLADKLRRSSKHERRSRHLYTEVYDELYKKVPRLSYVKENIDEDSRKKKIDAQMRFIDLFLEEGGRFLEIGPGNCLLSFHIAKFVKDVYAVDVSDIVTEADDVPSNFHLIISDGASVPVRRETIDVAYSNQLMEHLHPDDAVEQIENIHRALVKGGIYICITPNKFSGPHDVSKYFDDVATGLHLREYSYTELIHIFKKAAFSKVKALALTRFSKAPLCLPVFPFLAIEMFLRWIPRGISKRISRSRLGPLSINHITLIAIK